MNIFKTFVFILVLSFSTNVLAVDLNATRYLLKDEPAPFSGFLVEKERIEKAVLAVKELEYMKKLNDANVKYYEEVIKNMKLQTDLEMAVEKGRNKTVEEDLKKELLSKKVWYKQWWFTVPVTVGTMILFKTYIP